MDCGFGWRRARCRGTVPPVAAVAHTADNFFSGMDFRFLYDEPRKLFSIGFRPGDGTLDASCYDLLASEARLTSFIAIAKGEVPSSHWFRLGRALTPVGRGSALISWSGSMFEYLMPALVMRSPEESMLYQTYEQVVFRQMEYGAERGVPWGISESAFNVRDIDFTYQYSSFGVPGLGLKRGLSEDLVIAPYATALAAMIKPSARGAKSGTYRAKGGRGAYGFYESLDYTKTRVPEGKEVAVIHAYMAHHQGMSLVAFADVLTNGLMKTRFHSEPIVQATELLLQERTPRDVLVARPRAEEVSAASRIREMVAPVVRSFRAAQRADSAHASAIQRPLRRDAHLRRLRVQPLARHRRSPAGAKIPPAIAGANTSILRDEQTGKVWSAGYQPTSVEPDSYEAVFFEDHAEFIRRDRSLTTQLDVVVSSEDDAEVRRDFDHQSRHARARHSGHFLRGVVFGDPGGGRFASRLCETFRGDGIRRGRRRFAGHAPQTLERRGFGVGRARDVHRRRNRRRAAIRNRPRAFRGPRALAERPGLDHGRTAAVEHGRSGAGSDHQPAPHRSRSARRHGALGFLHYGRGYARRAPSISPTNIATAAPSNAPSRWPGPRRRCN